MPSKIPTHSWHIFTASHHPVSPPAYHLFTFDVCMTGLDPSCARRLIRQGDDRSHRHRQNQPRLSSLRFQLRTLRLLHEWHRRRLVFHHPRHSRGRFECVGSIYDDHGDFARLLKKVVGVFRPATMSISTTCCSHEVWTRVAGAVEPLGLKCRSCTVAAAHDQKLLMRW